MLYICTQPGYIYIYVHHPVSTKIPPLLVDVLRNFNCFKSQLNNGSSGTHSGPRVILCLKFDIILVSDFCPYGSYGYLLL